MKYLFSLLIFSSILYGCSGQSNKNQTESIESGEHSKEEKYKAPSSSPSPIPGQDPYATAIAMR